jgi:hypothetical protein
MGSGGVAPPFLTSALDGGEWSASRPARFTPGERAPGTHWITDWVGPRAGLDTAKKREISCPCRESNSNRPARSSSLYRLSYPGSVIIILQFNYLLFMCRINSYKANFRQHSVDTGNYITDKHNIKTTATYNNNKNNNNNKIIISCTLIIVFEKSYEAKSKKALQNNV